MKLHETLRAARDLNLSKRCKGAYARDKEGYMIHPLHPNAETFCAIGALKKVIGPEPEGVDDIDFPLELDTYRGVVAPAVKMLESITPLRIHLYHDGIDDEHMRTLWDDAIAKAERMDP